MPDTIMLFVGIKGTALALHRATGHPIWQTPLTGSSFVYVILDGDDLFATTQGEVFCLDPATGQIRWNNPLKGFGLGIASIAVRNGADGGINPMAEEILLAEQASQVAYVPPAAS